MLSESSTIIDFFGAEKLMAARQYLAAADAYYSCWERFQSADFIQDTEYQTELANDALDSCISVFSNHLTPEEQQGFLDKHEMTSFEDLLYADKGGFGVGAGEGRAAVCGHQSGDQGVRVEILVFSSGDRSYRASIVPLPGTNSVLVNR